MNLNELLTEFYQRGFDYLNDSGVGATRAKRWINQSYLEICEMDDWPFLRATATGVAPLTISDLGTIESCTNTTQQRNVGFVDYRTVVESYPDLTVTGAADYAYMTGTNTIATFPVSTDTLTVNYWKVPTELSALTDSPVLPSRYHYAIVDYAAGRAYIDSDNPEMAQVARADGDALVQMMRQRLLYPQHQDPDNVTVYGYSTDYR